MNPRKGSFPDQAVVILLAAALLMTARPVALASDVPQSASPPGHDAERTGGVHDFDYFDEDHARWEQAFRTTTAGRPKRWTPGDAAERPEVTLKPA